MVKNTYKKGRNAEIEIKQILENIGYRVTLAPKGNRFSKNKDFFNGWDLIAYMPNSSENELNWLVAQVKCNKPANIKRYIELAKELPKNTEAFIYVRCDGKGKQKVIWKEIDLRVLI